MSKILKESVQTPVEIPGVMYQTRELFQPVVSQPAQDTK